MIEIKEQYTYKEWLELPEDHITKTEHYRKGRIIMPRYFAINTNTGNKEDVIFKRLTEKELDEKYLLFINRNTKIMRGFVC